MNEDLLDRKKSSCNEFISYLGTLTSTKNIEMPSGDLAKALAIVWSSQQ